MPMLSSAERAGALSRFIANKKFLPERMYAGATSEPERLKHEAWVNELADSLQKLPSDAQTKARVLAELKPALDRFENVDSEERDRFLGYLEDLMDIFGIESSDGMLNKWRYGFDPVESPESRNASAIATMTPEERVLLSRLEGMTASTARSVLTEVLGPASSTAPGMQVWFLNADGSSGVSLMSQGSATVWSWLAKGRFLYSRRL